MATTEQAAERMAGIPTQSEIERALRRAWFPVARLSEVAVPKRVTLLGIPLVVFLADDGTPCAVDAACPHRGTDLGAGTVEGDCIVCPYHGWHWSGKDGACKRIPSLGDDGAIPRNAKTRAYNVALKWDLVWLCLDEPAVELPSPTLLDDVNWSYRHGPPITIRAGVRSATENFRDVAHFPFVHERTMGKLPHQIEPLDVTRDETTVHLRRRYSASGGTNEFMYHEDMLWAYENISPAFVCLQIEHREGKRILLNAPSPHTAPTVPAADGRHVCTIYWVEGVVGFPEERLEEFVAGDYAVYKEDNPILETLEPSEPPLGPTDQVHTLADRYNLEYRRAFMEFVRAAAS